MLLPNLDSGRVACPCLARLRKIVVTFAMLGAAGIANPQGLATTLPRFHQHLAGLVTAGQPTRPQFAEVKGAGYQVVINLSPANLPGALKDEQQVVENFGMKYAFIPVDWDKPSLDDLARFFDLLDQHKGEKVLVHCWLNARSSAFVFAYLTIRTGTDEKAEREVLTKIWDANKGYELRNSPQWIALLDQARNRLAK